MENTYRRIMCHTMARLNACVSVAKYFIWEGRRGGREKQQHDVWAVCTFRQTRKGEHDVWIFENSLIAHQERCYPKSYIVVL